MPIISMSPVHHACASAHFCVKYIVQAANEEDVAMQIYLILTPGHEMDEPGTLPYLHRATWIKELRRRYDDPTDNPNPGTLSEEELFKYIQEKTDDCAIECTLIGPDVDTTSNTYQRVVVIDNNNGEFKVYSNPSCLPPLQETDDIYHVRLDKWDVNNPPY